MKGFQRYRDFLVFGALMTIFVLVLFRAGFKEGMVVFSSDGPLSTLATAHNKIPEGFFGKWQDINRLGKPAGAAPLNLTWLLLWATGPMFFAKFYIPICLIFLGASAWIAFRNISTSAWVCGIGAAATLLNSNFFSYGCWGLGTIVLSAGFFLLAVASLQWKSRLGPIPSAGVTGLFIGLCVMEGFDVGIILSMVFAAYYAWNLYAPRESGDPQEYSKSPSRTGQWLKLGLTVIFSMLVAMQTVYSLFSTQVQGVAVLEEAPTSPQSKWDWATQWSLPINESIRLAIPGYFGYRMDTPNGGFYRGNVGRDPQFGKDNMGRIPRHSGSGFYAGIMVLILAAYAMVGGGLKKSPLFSPTEKHWIRFWSVVVVVSLGLSYGRHFFLYSMIHPLPFFNSIRNPIKFLHPMTIGLVILAVYGLKSILTSWADSSSGKTDAAASGGTTKEKRDPARLAAAILLGVPGLALLILLMVAGQRSTIQAKAIAQLVPEGVDAASAQLISQFVMGETFWFFIFCTLSAGTLAMALKRRIPNRHASLLPACILVLLVLDLWRADQPWIHHFDAGGKYVKDELVSALEPENGLSRGRVTTAPFNNNVFMNYVATFYRAEWLQHQFPYFNIASIDVPQESRPAVDFETFRTALSPTNNPARLRRFWELTSTRYILGLAQGVVDLLNSNFDPERLRFQVLKPFTIDEEIANRDNNVRALPSAQGPFAVIEFSGALERAVLYQNWMVHTNSNELLRHLADLSWDPMESVLVNGPQSPTASQSGNPNGRPVKIEKYSPTRMELTINTDAPAILMTTDKWDPDWHVSVNGQQKPLLHCDFLMRGVYLEPTGQPQTVVFHYAPPRTPLIVSIIALATGLGLLGFSLALPGRSQSTTASP